MIHPDIVSRVALDSWQMDASDLWVLMARAQVSESVSWLSSWLWRFRVGSGLPGGCRIRTGTYLQIYGRHA